ncbi:hypothetical protein IQ268_31060 [Oculatella sp. LEGE 06141]|uniref:hypothetical protein n=1 Tax=Oculatella sp. LEGE 06141 TaxID=1828648 RepID=UPI001880B989|nr:hypothetical protein [Oculatella sp. LEGE 06141]MBE9182978.1 hypothetical protein [Oculatella sp. LEGE 06141]
MIWVNERSPPQSDQLSNLLHQNIPCIKQRKITCSIAELSNNLFLWYFYRFVQQEASEQARVSHPTQANKTLPSG